MASSFDLDLLPLHRIKNQDWPQLPGLRVIAPPRNSARGREADHLLIYLTLAGNTPFSASDYDLLISTLGEKFHRSSGALTSALRLAAEAVNQNLVDRNLRTTGKGQYVVGRLLLGVPRGAQFFMALCGPVHVYHLAQEASQHFHESQNGRSGLGASQITPIHFAQVDLHAGDALALCSVLPPAWESLLNAEQRNFDLLRRDLPAATSDDLNAVLVRVQTGKGALKILPGVVGTGEASTAAGKQEKPAPDALLGTEKPSAPVAAPDQPAPAVPVSRVASEKPASRFSRLLSGESDEVLAPDTFAGLAPDGLAGPALDAFAGSAPPELAAEPAQTVRPARLITRPAGGKTRQVISRPGKGIPPPSVSSETPEIMRLTPQRKQQAFRGLAKWLRGAQVFTRTTSEKIKAFLPNLLPNLRDDEPRLTGVSMSFIAIVIPLLVVTAALSFYNRHGRTASYQENFDQAWAASVWASSQTHPAEVRVGWERTLYYLNIADDFQETDELEELRQRAQLALDNLDGILRLDFTPAIVGGLSTAVEVTRMAATNTDLYILDGAHGNVLRFYLGSLGYQADTQFECGPGLYDNGVRVGEIIDIAAAPRVNSLDATLIVLDSTGTLLLCRPSPGAPTAVPLATPSLGWRGISGFALDISSSYLYVLDPPGNAVWYYAPDQFGGYSTLPVMFFGSQIPANMPSVIDMVTNGADLYLLYNDGHVSACTLLEFEGVPKRCSDPAQFMDNRPDRAPGAVITDAFFTHMTFADPPDQALYLFDPLAQAVYRFSPRSDSLILQGQFRAADEDRAKMLVSQATAMTISPNRYIFISVSGQVYYATDVP